MHGVHVKPGQSACPSVGRDMVLSRLLSITILALTRPHRCLEPEVENPESPDLGLKTTRVFYPFTKLELHHRCCDFTAAPSTSFFFLLTSCFSLMNWFNPDVGHICQYLKTSGPDYHVPTPNGNVDQKYIQHLVEFSGKYTEILAHFSFYTTWALLQIHTTTVL